MDQLEKRRGHFAEDLCASAGVHDDRIRDAFRRVPRERFIGTGPWSVSESGELSPTADPAYVYQDIVIGLAHEKGITNGLPSLHAKCIDAVSPATGESVAHVGAGTGYYTALLAELVTHTGSVTAFEVDADLARKATDYLAPWPQVAVHHTDATRTPLAQLDVIYVSAGASSLPRAWLEALRPQGRLLLPLVPARQAQGAMLLVTRRESGYSARFITRARFYPCIGASEPASGLHAAFLRGDLDRVRSLRLDTQPDEHCWYAGNRWWLSMEALGSSP